MEFCAKLRKTSINCSSGPPLELHGFFMELHGFSRTQNPPMDLQWSSETPIIWHRHSYTSVVKCCTVNASSVVRRIPVWLAARATFGDRKKDSTGHRSGYQSFDKLGSCYHSA